MWTREASPRTRWLVLALFLAQAGQFWFQVEAVEGRYLFSDNTFYETPAWNLASGRGLTIARMEWEDPYLTRRFIERHPGRDAAYIPSVTFAPGYAWYLAGIYRLAGRSHLAAVVANGPLLAITLAAFVLLVLLCLQKERDRQIAIVLGAAFPFWAYWAARIMSDTLCNALLALATVLWLKGSRGTGWTILTGLVMGWAILTRPYAAFLPLAVLFIECGRRNWQDARRALIVTVVSGACLGGWMARNQYFFGVPLVTGMAPGFNLWQASYEVEHGRFATVQDGPFYAELDRLGIPDAHRVEAHEQFMRVVKTRFRAEPWAHVRGLVLAVPRLWIPQGRSMGSGARLGLGLYFGSLFVLMLVGGWRALRAGPPALAAMLVPVLYYTVAFMALHVESRYTLPARPMGLVLAAFGAGWVLERLSLSGFRSRSRVDIPRE